MSPQSRLAAGIVLIIVPTVEVGGASILSLLIADPLYGQNDLRQDLWRAGHAHAGVWLVLSLVALRYVDQATLSEGMRWVVRLAFPAAAILVALAFFLSALSPQATEPNALIYLAYVAGVVLAVGLLGLAVGLIRGRRTSHDPESREVSRAYHLRIRPKCNASLSSGSSPTVGEEPELKLALA